MIFAYQIKAGALRRMDPTEDLSVATWVDLYRPLPEQVEAVARFGFEVPSLADMQAIELSNRFYRSGGVEVLTVTLPGLDLDKTRIFAPVACLVAPDRLVTVRYHVPRPFETLPEHVQGTSAGCATPPHLVLSLMEEIVARLADLLETIGRDLDMSAEHIFDDAASRSPALQRMLRDVGRSGEVLAKYRLSLLTVERALSTFGVTHEDQALSGLIKACGRDIQALLVHVDFLSGRVAHLTDVILGMVALEDSSTGRLLSIVAVLFLPPTLVASVYGMNFEYLPGMDSPDGYLIATGLMALSALGTFLFFRWKGWL